MTPCVYYMDLCFVKNLAAHICECVCDRSVRQVGHGQILMHTRHCKNNYNDFNMHSRFFVSFSFLEYKKVVRINWTGIVFSRHHRYQYK